MEYMDLSGETLKRKHDEKNDENSAKKNSISLLINNKSSTDSMTSEMSTTDKTSIEPQLICFEFLSNKNFKNFSWKIVSETFSVISSSWEFLSFRNDYTSCIIKVFDIDCIKTLTDIQSIEFGSEGLTQVKVSVIKDTSYKGIVYNKFLIPISENEIKETLTNQGVIEAKKIFKPDNDGLMTPTGSVILIFDSNGIKENLIFDSIEIKVKKLTQKPMQCNHCGIIGHTLKYCNAIDIETCKVCFLSHSAVEKCLIECKNCHGKHSSKSKSCPAWIKEKEIIEIKEQKHISYSNARTIVEKKLNVREKSAEDTKRDLELKELTSKLENLNKEYQVSLKTIENFENIVVPELKEEINDLRIEIEEVKNNAHTAIKGQIIETNEKLKGALINNKETAKQLLEASKNLKILEQNLQISNNECIESKNNFDKLSDLFTQFVHFDPNVKRQYKLFHLKNKNNVSMILGRPRADT